ncbi:MAG: hypothetical protein ACR2N5_06245 [Solirubrobacterales bacterium]
MGGSETEGGGEKRGGARERASVGSDEWVDQPDAGRHEWLEQATDGDEWLDKGVPNGEAEEDAHEGSRRDSAEQTADSADAPQQSPAADPDRGQEPSPQADSGGTGDEESEPSLAPEPSAAAGDGERPEAEADTQPSPGPSADPQDRETEAAAAGAVADAERVDARLRREAARSERATSRRGGAGGESRRGIRRAQRRRRAVLIVGLAIVLAGAVVALEGDPAELAASGDAGESAADTAETEPATQQLSRGGTRILPNYEVLAYYGAPQAPELGVLGLTPPEEAVEALNVRAQEYGDLTKKPIYPTFELISTIAQEDPGPSGEYRFHQEKSLIEDYQRVANENDFLLILDIQPGRADFVDEVKRLKPFLKDPNVGIALDPEWHLPNGVPGEEIGSVKASVINRVAKLMSEQAREENLPQKLLIVHQFTDDMIRYDEKLKQYPKVALVLNADGFGTPDLKIGTYGRLAPTEQPPFPGFKLFFTEDTEVMSAQDVFDLQPRPKVVVYE